MAKTTKATKFPKQDFDDIQSYITKRSISQTDIHTLDEIFRLYCKYVDNTLPFYRTGCGDCPTSIVTILIKLREWFAPNQDKFYQ